jgi:hypothetical protein
MWSLPPNMAASLPWFAGKMKSRVKIRRWLTDGVTGMVVDEKGSEFPASTGGEGRSLSEDAAAARWKAELGVGS